MIGHGYEAASVRLRRPRRPTAPARARAAQRDGRDARQDSRSPATYTCPTRPARSRRHDPAAVRKDGRLLRRPGDRGALESQGLRFVGQDCRGRTARGRFDPPTRSARRRTGTTPSPGSAEQPWSYGRVALTGESYYAVTSYAAASIRTRRLACIAPGDFPVDRYDGKIPQRLPAAAAEALWAIWGSTRSAIPSRAGGSRRRRVAPADARHGRCRGSRTTTSTRSSLAAGLALLEGPLPARGPRRDRDPDPAAGAGWYDNSWASELHDWKRYRSPTAPGRRNYLMIGPGATRARGPAERVGILPVVEDGTHRWDRLQAVSSTAT